MLRISSAAFLTALCLAGCATGDRGLPAEEVRIDTECQRDGALVAATVFGSGVGIWNRERQLTLPAARVAGLLEAFRREGFDGLAESYGGDGDPQEPGGLSARLRVICWVRLTRGGTVKQVNQLEGGRQSPELRRLAEEILAVAGAAGRTGVATASLADGLGAVARGRLAPEMLRLQVHGQSERPGDPAGGWLLRLDGGRAEASVSTPEGGDGEPRTLKLGAAEVTALARTLSREGLADLPGNLYAPEPTDLTVEVLNRERNLQARRFAGMTPETHGGSQERFDRIVAVLRQLHRRVLAEGGP